MTETTPAVQPQRRSVTSVIRSLEVDTRLLGMVAALLIIWIGFDIAGETFLARLKGGQLPIARRPLADPDFAFTARDAALMAAL